MPIIIMTIGSIALFLLSFVFKKNLSADEFGKYSILSTYITMISSFGLFGSEQLLIREGKINNDSSKIELGKSASALVATSFILTISFSFIFDYLNIFQNTLSLISFSFFCVYLMFSYNVFRLLKKFIFSQLIQTVWKVLILVIALIFVFFRFKLTYLLIENIYLLTFIFSGLFVFIVTYRRVNINIKYIKHISKKDFYLTFYFFISLFTMSLIGNGDRLLIESKFDVVELGNYFFLNMLILFPFNFIQSYLGFIYIVEFRETDSPLSLINEKKKHVLKYLLLLIFSICFLLFITINFKFLTFSFLLKNWLIVVVFVLSGVVRLYYSIYSSYMGANGNLLSIKKANIVSFMFTTVVILFLYFFAKTLFLIALGFFIIWLIRLLIWKHYCLNNEN
jgi:O-antigen/teichoic acid export membrane protein